MKARIVEGPTAELQEESETPSPQAKFFGEFWTDLVTNHLRLTVPGQPPPRIPKSTNLYLSLPPSGGTNWISGFLAQSSRRAGVYLRLAKGGFGDAAWTQLLTQSDEINRELGEAVTWEEVDKAYYITMRNPMRDLKDPAERERVKRWLAEKLLLFATVFRPRLQAIEKAL